MSLWKTHKEISPNDANDAHPLFCNIQSDESHGTWSESYIGLSQLNQASTERIQNIRKRQEHNVMLYNGHPQFCAHDYSSVHQQ